MVDRYPQYRCVECTLMRNDSEGQTCEECTAFKLSVAWGWTVATAHCTMNFDPRFHPIFCACTHKV